MYIILSVTLALQVILVWLCMWQFWFIFFKSLEVIVLWFVAIQIKFNWIQIENCFNSMCNIHPIICWMNQVWRRWVKSLTPFTSKQHILWNLKLSKWCKLQVCVCLRMCAHVSMWLPLILHVEQSHRHIPLFLSSNKNRLKGKEKSSTVEVLYEIRL